MNDNERDTFAALFDKARDQHQPIADPNTGVVFPNHLALFVDKTGELTPFGKHLTETGEGGLEVTTAGLRFYLEDRRKPRAYWVDRARVFDSGRDAEQRSPVLFPYDDELEGAMYADETKVILDLPEPVDLSQLNGRPVETDRSNPGETAGFTSAL